MGRYVLVDVFTDTALEGNQLAVHGRIPFREQIEIRQGAEIGRPSTLYARVEGSKDRVERVEVGGSAVVVAHGEFRL